MSKAKAWCCTKNNVVSKQEVWRYTKSNLVSTKAYWCCTEKYFMSTKKSWCCTKKLFHVNKKIFCAQKKLIFFRNRAILITLKILKTCVSFNNLSRASDMFTEIKPKDKEKIKRGSEQDGNFDFRDKMFLRLPLRSGKFYEGHCQSGG